MKRLRHEQEIFDIAYSGLRDQEFVRCEYLGSCKYRCHGRKCAIGHLISDKSYAGRLEDLPATNLWIRMAALIHPEVTDKFLSGLQNVHDTSPLPKNMKTRLHLFAEYHSLTVPGMEESK